MTARAHVDPQGTSAGPGWLLAVVGLVFAGAFAGHLLGLAIRSVAPGFGPLTQLMIVHIFLMNVLAPGIAHLLHRDARDSRVHPGRLLAAASVFQITLLWAIHTPIAFGTLHNGTLHALFGSILFPAALWFWLAVLSQRGARRWRAIASLLMTGKLLCLLGVLLVFAPRALYSLQDASSSSGLPNISDQHLAGLLMIAACLLTYVLAAVVIAATWLKEMAERDQVMNGELGALRKT